MSEIPTSVKLDQKDADALRNLTVRAHSIEATGDMYRMSTENAITKLQEDTVALWTKLAAKYGLDIKHVNYSLGPDNESAVPLSMRFGQPNA